MMIPMPNSEYLLKSDCPKPFDGIEAKMTPEQAEWYQKGIESILSRCPYCGGSLGRTSDGRWGRTCMSEKCLSKQKTEAGRRSAAKGGNYRKW